MTICYYIVFIVLATDRRRIVYYCYYYYYYYCVPRAVTGGEAEEAEVPGGPAPCGEGGPQEEETAAQSPQTVSSAQHCLLSNPCLLYTSPSPRDECTSRMPSSA